MTPVGSARLHGKLWIDENDIRTSISYKNAGVAWGQPADLAGDRLQQTKELANVIVNGCGSWWFNVASNRYDHPEIQKLLANLVRCAGRSVALDRTPVDRFAVVLDATGPDYLRTGGRTAKEFLLERLPALSRSGAAFGHYITDDLDRLADHKLLLFPFSIAPDPAQVRALEKLKNSNRILVFFNGADSFPHRPGAPKGKNGDFTGIRIAKSRHSIPGDFTFTDVPGFTDGLAGKQFGNAKKRIDPPVYRGLSDQQRDYVQLRKEGRSLCPDWVDPGRRPAAGSDRGRICRTSGNEKHDPAGNLRNLYGDHAPYDRDGEHDAVVSGNGRRNGAAALSLYGGCG